MKYAKAQDTVYYSSNKTYIVGLKINNLREGIWNKYEGDILIGKLVFYNDLLITRFKRFEEKMLLEWIVSDNRHFGILYMYNQQGQLSEKEVLYSKKKILDIEELGEDIFKYSVSLERITHYQVQNDSITENYFYDKCINRKQFLVNNKLVFEYFYNHQLIIYEKELFEKHSEFFLENDLFLRLMLIK